MGINLLEKFFPAKTTITSATIKAEIDYSESEINRIQAQIGPKLAAIATMTDAEHVKAEADIAANKRAIDRLDQRIAHLQSELPAVLAAEEAAAKATADSALRARAEACRKANTKEAARLLAEYDVHANAIGEIVAKLKAMDTTREAINSELRTNPVCEPVRSYVEIHRTTPGTVATEQRAKVLHWVYRDAPPRPDEVVGDTEMAIRASLDDAGKPIPQRVAQFGRFGRIITPTLEKREVVVSRTYARPPRCEHSLDDVRLPPGFAGNGKWHWPRS